MGGCGRNFGRLDDDDAFDQSYARACIQEECAGSRALAAQVSLARRAGRCYAWALQALVSDFGLVNSKVRLDLYQQDSASVHEIRIGAGHEWDVSVTPHRDGRFVTLRFRNVPGEPACVFEVTPRTFERDSILGGAVTIVTATGIEFHLNIREYFADTPYVIHLNSITRCPYGGSVINAELRRDRAFLRRLLRHVNLHRPKNKWVVILSEWENADVSLRNDPAFALSLILRDGLPQSAILRGATEYARRTLTRYIAMTYLGLCTQRAFTHGKGGSAAWRIWTVARNVQEFVAPPDQVCVPQSGGRILLCAWNNRFVV